MKVTQTIQSLDRSFGGTASYLQLLDNELASRVPISVATLESADPLPFNHQIDITSFKRSFPYIQGYSNDLKKELNKIDTTLFHGNGMWDYPVHAMTKVARKRGLPYILSPHGMLEPWVLKVKKLKKELGLRLFQYDDLAHASCIHATAKSEAESIRALGLKNPIAIIPNGIDLSEYVASHVEHKNLERTVLFLSRIHPKKGIELLIEAWARVPTSLKQNWKVRIVGNGEEGYINTLNQQIIKKGLAKELVIEGPLFYEDKIKAFRDADLFVLPTYSENFGIVILEALASETPVITTKGAPWEELNSKHAGWWIEIGVDPLVEALTKALQLADSERRSMGLNGRLLVEDNYSIQSVANKMLSLYSWVAGQAQAPDFIQFD